MNPFFFFFTPMIRDEEDIILKYRLILLVVEAYLPIQQIVSNPPKQNKPVVG